MSALRRPISEVAQLMRLKQKAARRRLLNSNPMIVDQATTNVGFAFRRYPPPPPTGQVEHVAFIALQGGTTASGIVMSALARRTDRETGASGPKSATTGLMHRSKHHRPLDDLVRQRPQLIRHSQSECLGGLHADHQLELDWSLDRKLARLLAFEDAVGIGRRTPVLIDENRTVSDQAAEFS